MTPKGMVADHWTWREGKPVATGWHRPVKRGKKAEAEPTPHARSPLFEVAAKACKAEPQPPPQGAPSARRLRELDAPKKPKRAKPEQGRLL